MSEVLLDIDLPGCEKIATGKVREIFKIEDKLLLVASDRLSAFDVVFKEGIPGKGKVLTQLAAFWFRKTRRIVQNHFITTALDMMPEPVRGNEALAGRSTLCRQADVFPIECVVRGYLEGSGWKEYRDTGKICGIQLPPGLKRRSRIPEPIFTPSTKAEQGLHDENISFERCCEIIGEETAGELRRIALELYQFAHDWLDPRGITLADTKFEIGRIDGEFALVDEVLTPDSSRFWVKGSFEDGSEPISFDKQVTRDYLEATGWDKSPPPPLLPADVIEGTAKRYREIYEKITGDTIEI